MSADNAFLMNAAASRLLERKKLLEAEIESAMCNFTYETHGHRPMVDLDVHEVEAAIQVMGDAAGILLRLAKEGAS